MKAAIYIRTSTLTQIPENQIDSCKKFAESRGYEVEGIYKEQLSGFKDIERPQYNLIKDKAFKGQINAVIVWALDRWVRNRETLLDDVTLLRNYNCKLHSVQEAWLEFINIEGALGKTIQEFLLGLIGSIGEMESSRKSERVKIAYEKYKKEDRKYKKWGRRALSQRVIEDVIKLRKSGQSIRQIQKQVQYIDKNNNYKNLSVGAVHKIISGNMPNVE